MLIGKRDRSGRNTILFWPANGAGLSQAARPRPTTSAGIIDDVPFRVINDSKAGGPPAIYNQPANGPVRHTMPWDGPGNALVPYSGAIRDPALAGALALSVVDPDCEMTSASLNVSRARGAYVAGYQAGFANGSSSKAVAIKPPEMTTGEQISAGMQFVLGSLVLMDKLGKENAAHRQARQQDDEPVVVDHWLGRRRIGAGAGVLHHGTVTTEPLAEPPGVKPRRSIEHLLRRKEPEPPDPWWRRLVEAGKARWGCIAKYASGLAPR
jgi:hypothetical protein